MTKIHYCFALLLPPLFYYLALDFWPERLTHLWLGWPLSILFGVLVMVWTVLVGLWFASHAVAAKEVSEHE